MYFESRVHEIIEVENALNAALKIKSGNFRSYQVTCWPSKDQCYKMYAVPDSHIDNPLLELAILRRSIDNPDSPLQQVESITNGWIESPERLGRYLSEAETSTFIMQDNVRLIVGEPKGDERANFTCGCCGEWFNGNVRDQLKFDQDAGYGICDSCAKGY